MLPLCQPFQLKKRDRVLVVVHIYVRSMLRKLDKTFWTCSMYNDIGTSRKIGSQEYLDCRHAQTLAKLRTPKKREKNRENAPPPFTLTRLLKWPKKCEEVIV